MDKVELIKLIIEMIIVPLLIWGIAIVNRRISEKVELEQTKNILHQATSIVEAVVHETSQTFVDDLKMSGDFDKDKARQALELSKQRALEIISPASYNLLEQVVGDVNGFIEAQIEATVWAEKRVK